MRTVLVVLLAAAACGGSDESAGLLVAFSPVRAYTDDPVAGVLRGGPFRPSFSVDTSSGAASVDVQGFAGALLPSPAAPGAAPDVLRITGMVDPSALTVRIPAGLPVGGYDVELRDPRGRVSMLMAAFQSLGPDVDAPDVALDGPLGGTFVVIGTHVPVIVRADDGDGHLVSLGWTLTAPGAPTQMHSCPPPLAAPQSTCSDGELVVPDGNLDEPMIIRSVATDLQGNVGSREDLLWRAQSPVITSVAPAAGPAMGMTQILVRGQGFARASRVLIDAVPITPGGGIVESSTTIRGFTVAHDPGSFAVVVETGNQLTSGPLFTFVAAPVIRRISPAEGPAAGGTTVTIVGSHFVCEGPGTMGTRFSVGAGVARVDVTVTDCGGPNRVVAVMPPYPVPAGGTGTVSLFALDPEAGESELPNAFTYNAPPPAAPAPPDAGAF